MSSFARFLSRFITDTSSDTPAPSSGRADCAWLALLAKTADGADSVAFFSAHAGQSFGQGLYRLHGHEQYSVLNQLACKAFPDFAHRISCFASDWLGRQFALDSERHDARGESHILLLEPGSGEVLEIPAGLVSFHDEVLLKQTDAALASELHSQWLATGHVPPAIHQCAGYRIPPLLDGEDSTDNLILQDMARYWSISAQVLGELR